MRRLVATLLDRLQTYEVLEVLQCICSEVPDLKEEICLKYGRPRRTWEDCVIDAARRKGKTSADLRRLARDRTAFRKWTEDPTLQGNRDR
jgi:hypothetical protein